MMVFHFSPPPSSGHRSKKFFPISPSLSVCLYVYVFFEAGRKFQNLLEPLYLNIININNSGLEKQIFRRNKINVAKALSHLKKMSGKIWYGFI